MSIFNDVQQKLENHREIVKNTLHNLRTHEDYKCKTLPQLERMLKNEKAYIDREQKKGFQCKGTLACIEGLELRIFELKKVN